MKRKKLFFITAMIIVVVVAVSALVFHWMPDFAADRLYATLQNDNADPEQWVDAAYRLTLPADVTVRGQEGRNGSTWPAHKSGDVVPLKGEPLRSKTNPSVLDLLARRAEQTSSDNTFAMDDACRIAIYAAKWDPQGSRKLLADQMHRSLAYIPRARGGVFPSAQEQLTQRLAKITIARIDAGDAASLQEYADYLRTFDVQNFSGFSLIDALEPLWRSPNDPVVQKIAAELFLHSPAWQTAILQKHSNVLNSPLLGIESFRQFLLSKLADETLLATITPPYRWPRPLTAENQWMQGFLGYEETDPLAPDPLAPTAGELPVRTCDLYASGLSQVRGLPWVAWYWPTEKREPARALMIQRLKQYGPRFAYNPSPVPGDPDANWPEKFYRQAQLSFSKLDHPASQAQVDQGLAIFSLEGQGDRRLAPLPAFPARAKWTTLMEHPTLHQVASATRVANLPFVDQSGLIWQAEEVLQNGKWVRYYGFVGRHVLQKVPADQIEFLPANERYFRLKLPTSTAPSK